MTYLEAINKDCERLGIPVEYSQKIWEKYIHVMFSIYVLGERKAEDFFYGVFLED